MPTPRYSLAEAQQVLAEARARIDDLVAVAEELEALADEGADAGVEAARLRANLDDVLRWFDAAGIQIKSVRPTLLDFPARAIRDGEGIDVLLCWREDEDAIAYYHPREGGYRSREPVALLDRV